MIKKVSNFLKKRHYFKKGKILLEQGKYCLSGSQFFFFCRGVHISRRRDIIRIKKSKISISNYSFGSFFVGKDKAKFIFNDSFFFFLYDKQKYTQIKKSYNNYSKLLNYKTAKYNFFDSKLLISSPIVNGKQFSNNDYFFKFLKRICLQYTENRIFERKNLDNFKSIPFFIQHGDCKNSNIIWQDDEPVMIDLEAVNSYPIFYDLFYYTFITKKVEAIYFFDNIRALISNVSLNIKTKYIGDPLDYYLSCYLTYLSKYVSKKYNLYVLNFYLEWITYSDYAFLPILKKTIRDVMIKIKKIGYKLQYDENP